MSRRTAKPSGAPRSTPHRAPASGGAALARVSLWPGALFVFAATSVAFIPAFAAGFVNYDDDRLLLSNPYLRMRPGDALAWMWSTTFLGHYQPLTWTSYAIEHAVAGFNPALFHADNVALHAFAAALLYIVCAMLIARAPRVADVAPLRLAAAAGALLWAVHPLRVESVAWVAERRDPLSAVFWLLALAAYLRAVAPRETRLVAPRWLAVSCVCLLLSLLSKAWGMTFFVVLIVIDVYPLERLPARVSALSDRRYRGVWLEKVPFAALGIAAALVAWLAQHSQPDTMVGLARWGVGARLLQAAYGLCFYVARTIWPARLAVLYPMPASVADVSVLFGLCAMVVVVAAALVAWRARAWPAVAAAVAAYVVIVSPVLGLAQSGPQLVADRYAYLSMMPLSALIARAIVIPGKKDSRPPLLLVVGIIAVGLGVATWRQTAVWHDSISLWQHTLATGHPSYIAHLDYGQALRARGDTGAAIAQYRAAVALRPDAGSAWYNLGNALKASGDLDGAERAYLTAMPFLTWRVDAQVNLGNLYFSRQRVRDAIGQYRAAVATLDTLPHAEVSPEPYLYLGQALSDIHEPDEARRYLTVALRYPATRARADRELRDLAARKR